MVFNPDRMVCSRLKFEGHIIELLKHSCLGGHNIVFRALISLLRLILLFFLCSPLDVICDRGSSVAKHEGNLRFRQMIKDRLSKYSEAKSKIEKSLIVTSVVDSVRDNTPDGGFVKEIEKGVWVEVGGKRLFPVNCTGCNVRSLHIFLMQWLSNPTF